MAEPLSFKDFLTVDYTPGMPDQISYNAMKRKRGRIGEEVESTDEALNFQQRRARSRAMKKNKAKVAMGRRRAMKKAAGLDQLKKRARKSALKFLFKKLAKGQSRSELPAARRQEIEKRLDKMKPKVDRIARRMLKDVRAREKQRRMSSKKTGE